MPIRASMYQIDTRAPAPASPETIPPEEKMLLCIEPLLLFPGVEGYQIEDEVLVTKGGHEILSNLMDTSNLYEI